MQANGETKHHSSIPVFCTKMYCSLFFKTCCTAISRILMNNQNVQVKMLSWKKSNTFLLLGFSWIVSTSCGLGGAQTKLPRSSVAPYKYYMLLVVCFLLKISRTSPQVWFIHAQLHIISSDLSLAYFVRNLAYTDFLLKII